ncbi:MAG TPA: hypothetical protein VGZ22_24375 [Isosphaeraceae bacterium]|jgi:hypothetical protein|nr:hypothetical protein [Isosphaeraceae bacterium]
MPRFSIFGMMGFVLAVAIGLAAILNADDTWACIMLLLAFGLCAIAVVGLIYLRGSRRAWWIGFLIFEGGYLALALGPWFSERMQSKLATSIALDYVHDLARPSLETAESRRLNLIILRMNLADEKKAMRTLAATPSDPQLDPLVADIVAMERRIALLEAPAPASRWQNLLPGAANHEPFLRVRHSLFAMIAGLVGAFVGCRFHARRERNEERAGS